MPCHTYEWFVRARGDVDDLERALFDGEVVERGLLIRRVLDHVRARALAQQLHRLPHLSTQLH